MRSISIHAPSLLTIKSVSAVHVYSILLFLSRRLAPQRCLQLLGLSLEHSCRRRSPKRVMESLWRSRIRDTPHWPIRYFEDDECERLCSRNGFLRAAVCVSFKFRQKDICLFQTRQIFATGQYSILDQRRTAAVIGCTTIWKGIIDCKWSQSHLVFPCRREFPCPRVIAQKLNIKRSKGLRPDKGT